ncbi:hypothetical protein CC662_23570 [Salmonella enterica subsp. enterica]|nr:hypothetical protein [Salmonella enterica subsp. enterica]
MNTLAEHTRPGMPAAMVLLCETVEYKAATTERLQPGRMRDFSVQRVSTQPERSMYQHIRHNPVQCCVEHDIHTTLSLR